ncbi:hypothetical protein COMA2_30327 [Candidatus Nitrospira nitrificans]|uniref:Uncharacterized protein n=1 Tax=Candidatus Nitrospira nitrificans TaxID=1742973 RepID=A0A0S4LJ09_9BACT|nr:hypothetical protein COMA2_30327 [Candidatus Nitrospira nitrificans]
MPSKKPLKPTSLTNNKWKSRKKPYARSSDKSLPLLDTSGIPWFSGVVQTTRKTATGG